MELIRNASLSVTGFMIACRMLEKIGPTTKSTLSPLDQFLRLVDGNVRLQLVIDDDDLGLQPAELAAQILDREEKPVSRLLTQDSRRAGKRVDQADLDAVCGQRRTSPKGNRRAHQPCRHFSSQTHQTPLLVVF